MRAVVLAAPGEVAVAEVAEPRIEAPDDVIVTVELAGICGTDLHVIRGDLGGATPGTVLGHEFVGTVLETGSGVRHLRAGQRVMSSDFTACGRCRYCRRQQHWHCEHRQFFGTGTAFGPALAGAQAERVRVPFAETTLGIVPDRVDPGAALLVGDNLATGWTGVQRARVAPGDVVAVLGGGAVGQLAALSALVCGAGVVVLSDPVAGRRQLAASLGAVPSTPQTLLDDLRELTDGRGADAVIEAAGGPKALDAALAACRPAGRVVSLSAHSAAQWSFPLADSFAREITLGFAIGDSIRERDQLFGLLASGVLDPAAIISGRRPLAQAPAGYRELEELRSLKLLLHP